MGVSPGVFVLDETPTGDGCRPFRSAEFAGAEFPITMRRLALRCMDNCLEAVYVSFPRAFSGNPQL